MKELLIGCGNSRKKRVTGAWAQNEWTELVTLDIDSACKPDIVHDLNVLPLPFADNEFSEIHAYEVLEHCGRQGDYRFFFDQFAEFWRILKPDGWFVGTVPMWDQVWAWGDPGHTRVITAGSLTFLSQDAYANGVGNTAMTDYRSIYKANFQPYACDESGEVMAFVLRAVK